MPPYVSTLPPDHPFFNQTDPCGPHASRDLPLLLSCLSTRLSNCCGRKDCVWAGLPACRSLTHTQSFEETTLYGWWRACVLLCQASKSVRQINSITSKPETVCKKVTEDNTWYVKLWDRAVKTRKYQILKNPDIYKFLSIVFLVLFCFLSLKCTFFHPFSHLPVMANYTSTHQHWADSTTKISHAEPQRAWHSQHTGLWKLYINHGHHHGNRLYE